MTYRVQVAVHATVNVAGRIVTAADKLRFLGFNGNMGETHEGIRHRGLSVTGASTTETVLRSIKSV